MSLEEEDVLVEEEEETRVEVEVDPFANDSEEVRQIRMKIRENLSGLCWSVSGTGHVYSRVDLSVG